MRLAEQGFHVVGVDPSTEMVSMAAARPAENVRIVHIKPGDPLPFAPGEFDALWVCTVLQHICDEALLKWRRTSSRRPSQWFVVAL
jgi:SAM-dependent methyltransferase